jgi:ABC-type glutathione transport system ATPase component
MPQPATDTLATGSADAELGVQLARARLKRHALAERASILYHKLMREAVTYAIETRGLHKRSGSNHIPREVDLRITDGTAAAVLGPSGTGKSVLIKHVLGLLRPDEGEVFVEGRALSGMGRRT